MDLCRLSYSNYGSTLYSCTTNKMTYSKKKNRKKVVLTASRNRLYGASVGPREIALY